MEYLFLLFLSISAPGVSALSCVQCTSDPSAPNLDCIGDENGTMNADQWPVD